MKSLSLTQVITVGSFVMLAAAGAKAESYNGVQSAVSAKSRAEVNAEAVNAASAPNQNVVRGSRGAEKMAVSQDRGVARAEAMRAATAPDQNVSAGSRVNSRVVSTMPNAVDASRSAASGRL